MTIAIFFVFLCSLTYYLADLMAILRSELLRINKKKLLNEQCVCVYTRGGDVCGVAVALLQSVLARARAGSS